MSQAQAALGDAEAAVGSDQQKLRASRDQRTSKQGYSIHELVSDMHTVREFIGHDGTVFAVSWQGNIRPDLKTLLGNYFSDYSALDEARPRMQGRRPVTIRTDKIVVMKSGHMRDVRGIAYIPSRLPANVNLEDLQ
jgi:hypothetical protein